ncbi:MAG: LuxR C-terminal-related transcriptional regulator [Bacteroidales bacterium]
MPIVVAGQNRLAKDSLIANINTHFNDSTYASDNLEDILNFIQEDQSDAIILLDYEMGATAEALSAMRGRSSRQHRVAVYGAPGDPDEAMRWLYQGYDGYLPRSMSAPAIICAIQLMMRGERFVPSITLDGTYRSASESRPSFPALSPRQAEILAMVATGVSNKHIARALKVEEVTVKSHVKAIFRKLGVHSRTEAARFVLTGAERPRLSEAAI